MIDRDRAGETPATDEDVISGIAFALLKAGYPRRERGRGFVPTHEADGERASMAAAIVKQLKLSNFRIYKGPPSVSPGDPIHGRRHEDAGRE